LNPDHAFVVANQTVRVRGKTIVGRYLEEFDLACLGVDAADRAALGRRDHCEP
jgi:hypothetical protein